MGEQSAVIGEMGETTTKVKSDQNKKKQLLRSPCHCKQRKWKYGPRRATPRTTKSVEVAINGEQKSVSSGVSNQMAATPQRSRTITRESTGHEHRSDCGCTCGRLSGDVHMSSPRLTVSRLQEDRLQWWQCKQGVHEELKNYPYSSEGLSPTCTSVHCTLPTTNIIDLEKHLIDFEEKRRTDPDHVQYKKLYTELSNVTVKDPSNADH